MAKVKVVLAVQHEIEVEESQLHETVAAYAPDTETGEVLTDLDQFMEEAADVGEVLITVSIDGQPPLDWLRSIPQRSPDDGDSS